MLSVFDRLQAQLSPGLLHPLAAFGCPAGFERSAMDGLAGGFGLDFTSTAGWSSPGLGVRHIPPTMLLCPTPHYAVTVASEHADCEENRTATTGGGGVNWMTKSSSIAELRLKAQKYAAMLDMR